MEEAEGCLDFEEFITVRLYIPNLEYEILANPKSEAPRTI